MMIDQPYDPPSEANIDWEKVGFDVVAVNAGHHPSGLIPDGHTVCGRLPQGVIAFTALKSDAKDLGAIFGGGIPTRGMLPLTVGQRNFFYFRVEQGGERFDKSALPDTVRLLQAGDIVPLPLTTQIDLTIASISEKPAFDSPYLQHCPSGVAASGGTWRGGSPVDGPPCAGSSPAPNEVMVTPPPSTRARSRRHSRHATTGRRPRSSRTSPVRCRRRRG